MRNSQKKGKDEVDRSLFHGWDNYTHFEKDNIQRLKEFVNSDSALTVLREQIANGKIDDGEILKYLQTYQFKMKATAKSLAEHASWQISNLPCKSTSETLKLLVSRFLPIRKSRREYSFHVNSLIYLFRYRTRA